MNAEVNRRVFVGSMAAGLPFLAGATTQLAAQSGGAAHVHPSSNVAKDPMFDHALRQMAGILNRTKARGLTGEDARAIAAHLQTLVVYGNQINIDAPAKKALRELVRRRGRDATLYLQIDRLKSRNHLKEYGVDADERWFDTDKADYETRALAFDDLMQSGVTGLLAHTGTTFELIAAELDRRGGQLANIRRVQDDWTIGFCQQLQREISRLSMDAAFVCGASVFFAMLTPVCGAIEIAIGVQLAYAFYYGC
jgi:hypothetical protein